MAKANVDCVRLRPDTNEENRTVLREVQARKEVDARKQDELCDLFDGINAECASRSLAERRRALASPEKQEKIVKAVHYGPLPEFPSGTWWGIRMDCSRDCIHEPFNENIHNGPFGAVSICTSHLNPHNDIDLGDILTYTSREYHAKDQSKDSLVLSYKNRVPLRLVRSYCLSNKYAPKTGYRYDGLYTVVDYWIGVSADSTKHRKFVLTRVLDQERPPWDEEVNKATKVSKMKKSISPRLTRTRSHSKVNSQKQKSKFAYNKIQKESKVGSVSSIVSRQVFKKFIPGSPDSSPKSVSSTDSTSQSSCSNSCPTKLCNTNLSIRTNLYDSSHKLQNVKKATMTFCKILKPTQLVQSSQKSVHEEMEKISSETSDTDTEVMDKIPSSNSSTSDECTEKKVKKVTWADSCSSTSSSIEKSLPTAGNGFQYSGSDVVDGFSPTSPKNCGVLKCNNVAGLLPSKKNSNSNSFLSPSTKSSQHIVEVHSRSNVAETSKTSFSIMCEPFHETEILNEPSSSIDSLAPDELVNVIVKEKYHPMAKLLIGNMIGLENQESAILSAYNTLTTKVDQEDTKKSKENKLRNKFYIRNKSRKNGVLKKQRREIANLIIDAKFDTVTRGSRNRRLRSPKKRISKSEISQRKIMNVRRIQSRNLNKEIRNTVRELQPKKPEKRKKNKQVASPKRPKMITVWTQCASLAPPTVDQSFQVGDSCIESTLLPEANIKVEVVELDDIKSEPCDMESANEEAPSEPDTNYTERNYFSGSAFAAVNTVSSIRIARLRSIGFRPITCSPMEDEDSNQDSRPDVDEEYNKYTSEENNVVGYMDEQLHFEDIEEEEMVDITDEYKSSQKTAKKQLQRELSPQPIETLSERDFDKPWHGWRKISANGQVYWTGY